MANYKGHLAGGFAIFLVTVYCLRNYNPTIITLGEWLAFCLAGSLFPDIDTKSKGQKLFYRLSLLILLTFILNKQYTAASMLSVAAFVPMLVNHRALFHRLWFIVLFPSVIAVVLTAYMPQHAVIIRLDTVCFVMGAFSHLLLDLGVRKTFRF